MIGPEWNAFSMTQKISDSTISQFYRVKKKMTEMARPTTQCDVAREAKMDHANEHLNLIHP